LVPNTERESATKEKQSIIHILIKKQISSDQRMIKEHHVKTEK